MSNYKFEIQSAESKSREIMTSFFRQGTKDLTKCAKLSLVTCDQIINETLTEYTNDENHERVLFYKEVKKWLLEFIRIPTLEQAISNHPNNHN